MRKIVVLFLFSLFSGIIFCQSYIFDSEMKGSYYTEPAGVGDIINIQEPIRDEAFRLEYIYRDGQQLKAHATLLKNTSRYVIFIVNKDGTSEEYCYAYFTNRENRLCFVMQKTETDPLLYYYISKKIDLSSLKTFKTEDTDTGNIPPEFETVDWFIEFDGVCFKNNYLEKILIKMTDDSSFIGIRTNVDAEGLICIEDYLKGNSGSSEQIMVWNKSGSFSKTRTATFSYDPKEDELVYDNVIFLKTDCE